MPSETNAQAKVLKRVSDLVALTSTKNFLSGVQNTG